MHSPAAPSRTRSLHALNIRRFHLQDLSIKKKERIKCLVLSGSCDVFVDGEVRQKCAHMLGTKLFWVAPPVETNVSLDPIAIGFFSSQAEMSEASYIAHLIEQFPVGH